VTLLQGARLEWVSNREGLLLPEGNTRKGLS